MASPAIARLSPHAILFLSISTTLLLSIASAREFTVGDSFGWTVPADTDYYNIWSVVNLFHVGDILDFKNATSSVLVVGTFDKYVRCNTTDPIQELPPGNSVFQFPRCGIFYFISSKVDDCLAGMRMILRVMENSEPSPSPPPASSAPAAAPPHHHLVCSKHHRPCGHNNSSAARPVAAYRSLETFAAFLEIDL